MSQLAVLSLLGLALAASAAGKPIAGSPTAGVIAFASVRLGGGPRFLFGPAHWDAAPVRGGGQSAARRVNQRAEDGGEEKEVSEAFCFVSARFVSANRFITRPFCRQNRLCG